MVSIDLQKAGRLIGQPVGVMVPNDHRHQVNSKAEGHVDEAAAGNRPDIIKQHMENTKKSGSNRQAEAPKQSQERWRESKHGDSKTEKLRGHSDDRCLDTPWQKHDKHSDLHHKEEMNELSHTNQAEAQKSTSKLVPHMKHGEDKGRDRNKDKDTNREGDINMEDTRGKCKDRQSNKDRDRENAKGEDGDRDKVRNRRKDRDRQKDKDETKDRNKDRDKNKDRDETRDGNKVRDKNKDRGVDKDGEESRDKHKDRDRTKEMGAGTNKSKDRDKNKDKDVGTSKTKGLLKDRHKDRGESTDRHKEKERNKAKARDEDSERDVGKIKTKDRERDMMRSEERGQVRNMDKNRDRDKNREKDKERKQQSSQENCSRPPPEQHSKPESAAEKHNRIRKLGDPKGHQVSENPSVPNAQNKQDRRSGDGGVSCKAGKQQPAEMKLGHFPPFLFGGSSGSLKNFVIPKLTRNSGDLQPADKLKEPLVRLKRVSLIENLNRRAKPVVVLQRLSANEVKQIIKESRNSQSSRWYFNKSDRGMTHEYLSRNFELWME